MTATSARLKAPKMVKIPTRTHAASAKPDSDKLPDTAEAFLNTPEPITVPTTMAVAVT